MKKIKVMQQLSFLFFLIFRSIELLAAPDHILVDFEKFKIEEQNQERSQIEDLQPLERWSEHTTDSSISNSQDWPSRSVGQRSQVIEYKFDVLGISFIPFHFKGERSYASLNRLIDRKLHSGYFDKVFIIIKNELKNGNKEFKSLVEEEGRDDIEVLSYSVKDMSKEKESSSIPRHSESSVLSIHNIEAILSKIEDKTLLVYVDNVKWNLVNFRKRLDLTNSLRESDFED